MGAAVAVNAIGMNGGTPVTASVERSTLLAKGAVTISGEVDPAITAYAVAVSIGLDVGIGTSSTAVEVTIGGGVITNWIADVLDVHVSDSTICAGANEADSSLCTGAVTVSAAQTGTITAAVFAASMSFTFSQGATVALAGSAVSSHLGSTVTAAVKGTSRVSGGSVSITATANNPVDVSTVAVGVGFTVNGDGTAVAVSGAGAATLTSIAGSVTASVDGATVNAGTGGVFIQATAGASDRTITSTATAAALTLTFGSGGPSISGGFDAAISTVAVGSMVHAEITDGAGVTTTGWVQVLATSRGCVGNTARGGSLGASGNGDNAPAVSLTLTVVSSTSTVTEDVRAAVSDSTATGSAIVVQAVSSVPITGVAEAVTLGLTVSEPASVSLGGAGAKVTNETSGSVTALIRASVLTATSGALSVTAQSGADPILPGAVIGVLPPTQSAQTVAVAGTASVSGGGAIGIAVAATEATNRSGIGTRASVESGADVCAGTRSGTGECTPTTEPVTIRATSTELLVATNKVVSLSITFGTAAGSAAIAAAKATNTAAGSTEATVQDASVAGGSVTVAAQADVWATATATAVDLGIGAGGGPSLTLTAAGATAENLIGGTVTASVTNADLRAAGGDIIVGATGRSTLVATVHAGSVALSASATGFSGSLAVGVGFAHNELTTTVQASASGASLDAGGRVLVQASGDCLDPDADRLHAQAVAVAVAVAIADPQSGFGLAVAGAGTQVTDTASGVVAAKISSSTVVARAAGPDPAIGVSATDSTTSSTQADAVSLSLAIGAAGAIGGSEATATLSTSVEASVDGSTLSAPNGPVAVSANRTAIADATTEVLSVAVGVSAAVAGAVSSSTVAGAAAAEISGDSTVSTGKALTVAAVTQSRSSAGTTASSGAILFGVTAVAATATTTATTEAIITDATITAAGVTVSAARSGLDPQDETTLATAFLDAIALIAAGATGEATATDSGYVSARIGTGSSISSATGEVKVTAIAVTLTRASPNGGAAGEYAGIVVPVAVAIHSAATTAFVDTDTVVVAASLRVYAESTSIVKASVYSAALALGGALDGSAATATESGNVEAYVGTWIGADPSANPFRADVTDELSITAAIHQDTSVAVGGVDAGGLIGIGAMIATATNSATALAYVGNGTRLSARTLTVVVRDPGGLITPATRSVTSTTTTASVGLVSAAASRSDASITGSLEAYVGDSVTLAVLADTTITATGAATATATGQGGAGGVFVSAAGFLVTARIAPTNAASPIGTRAWVGSGTTLTTGTLTVEAVGIDVASATFTVGSISLVSGSGGQASAAVVSDVAAYLGTPTGTSTTTITATGAVTVQATSTQRATTTATEGTAGAISLSWADATAEVGRTSVNGTTVVSTVAAFLGDGVTVTSAGSLLIRAESLDAAAGATLSMTSAGLIAISKLTATATSAPTITAYLGAGVQVGSATPVAENVTVAASGRAEVDASSRAHSGGGVAVVPPRSVGTLEPIIDAHIGTMGGAVTTVRAAHNIALTALLSTERSSGEDHSDLVAGINADGDELTFSYPLIGEGSQVMFSAGGTAVSGLHDGSVYTVLSSGSDTTIRLGSLFALSAIDPDRETIRFPSGHGYLSGDCVWYDPRGGTSIIKQGADAGCGSGSAPVAGARAFYVRVVDATTIKLTTTLDAANAVDDATIAVTPSADGTTVTPASQLTVGEAVIYRAGVNVLFTNTHVNVTLVPVLLDDGNLGMTPQTDANGNVVHSQADNVFVDAEVYGALNEGDALYLRLLSGDGGIAHPANHLYYVIKTGDGYTIQLALTYCQAVGHAGDPTTCDQEDAVEHMRLEITGDDTVAYQLEGALGDLTDGHTYYVTSVTGAGAVTLALKRGTGPGVPSLNVDGTHRPGGSRLGRIEVDLVAPAGADQALIADIAGCPSDCGRLLASSGQPLSTIIGSMGNGASNVTAFGGGKAVAGFDHPQAFLVGRVTVRAVAVGTLIAGADVDVTADSQLSVTSSADTDGSGGISIGDAESTIDLADPTHDYGVPTTILLAGTIIAGGNLVAKAGTDHYMSSSAVSVGHGVVAVRHARSKATIDDDTTIEVVDGAALTAGGALRLEVAASNTGYDAPNAAAPTIAGSGAYANDQKVNDTLVNGIFVGSQTDPADRRVDIGSGAQLTAGFVELLATVAHLDLTTYATTSAEAIVGVKSHAHSLVTVYSDTEVHVAGGATITGTSGVDLVARQDDLTVSRNGTTKGSALVKYRRLYEAGTDDFSSRVIVDRGATITAGPRGSLSSDAVPPAEAGRDVALYVAAVNSLETRNFVHGGPARDDTTSDYQGFVNWDGDVVVTAAPDFAPILVVGADGIVLTAYGVLVGGRTPGVGQPLPAGSITIDPGAAASSILMKASNGIHNATSGAGQWPVFDFHTAVPSITVVNYSDQALLIDGIDVTAWRSTGDAVVKLEPNGGGASGFNKVVTLQFDVRRTAGPTYVDIEQRSRTAQALVLQGSINNPVGLTRLVNLNGSIIGTWLITTHQLDVFAPNGSIGAPDAPLTVDLVRYTASGGAAVDPRLVIDAGGDLYLSLRGDDRTGTTVDHMNVFVDAVTVGGSANLVLRTALSQPVASSGGGNAVYVGVFGENSNWAASDDVHGLPHYSHFRGANSTDPTVYDPGSAGAIPDASQPTGAGTAINSTVWIAQRNQMLARVEASEPGWAHYISTGTLFDDTVVYLIKPGISANGIVLNDTVGAGGADSADGTTVSVYGWADPDRVKRSPFGRLDIDVAGFIDLVLAGNATLGAVESRTTYLVVSADGTLADDATATGTSDGCDLTGTFIEVDAQRIGAPDAFVESCLADNRSTQGSFSATATFSMFIAELSGDLRLYSASVTTGDPDLPNDLTLVAADGSILDADPVDDATADVTANRIVLVAHGSIGDSANALEINSSTVGWRSGFVYADAWNDVTLVETTDELLILGAISVRGGSVSVATPDTAAPDRSTDAGGVSYQSETIELLVSGQVVLGQGMTFSSPSTDPNKKVMTGVRSHDGAVTIVAGDDVRAPAGTSISAWGAVRITVDAGDADPGRGGYAYLGGTVGAGQEGGRGTTTVTGGADADTVVFDSTTLLSATTAVGGGRRRRLPGAHPGDDGHRFRACGDPRRPGWQRHLHRGDHRQCPRPPQLPDRRAGHRRR